MARATKAKKADLVARRQPTIPPVGDGSAMQRVLGVTVVHRGTLESAQDALYEAMRADNAQVVAKHFAGREQALADIEALTAKVREVVA